MILIQECELKNSKMVSVVNSKMVSVVNSKMVSVVNSSLRICCKATSFLSGSFNYEVVSIK